MKAEDRLTLLAMLNDIQEETAPISVKIGYVEDSGGVNNEALVITDAPPKAIYEVVAWCKENGRYAEVGPRGVIVF